MDITPILYVTGAALVRNIAGWAENSFEDGQIQDYEWKELGVTFFRVGIVGVALAYGLDLSGFQAAGGAILGDFLLKIVDKFRK